MQEHMTPTQISTRLLWRGVRHGVLGCGGKGGGKGRGRGRITYTKTMMGSRYQVRSAISAGDSLLVFAAAFWLRMTRK